ncbi:MAG: glyoxylate/hydroxypyruvate reductase A [Hyphomicrobiaceae bacterium]|jgi:glyoxylate/hydroxypyruvate reductase A
MALLIIGSDRLDNFYHATKDVAPDRDVRAFPDIGNPSEIKYALAWKADEGALKKFENLELIVSVGAGVDHLFNDPNLPDVPIVRYVDPDLTTRMVQYVVLQTLFHVRRMTEIQAQQRTREWNFLAEPLPSEVRVGIMGIGVLGQACATALGGFGYQINGWSRSEKSIDGVNCFAGDAGLEPFLNQTDVLVVLLPFTPATKGILNRDLFAKLSTSGRQPRLPGPVLINAGRGGLQVETDILAALEGGSLYAASLDVFETEPLSADSPLWANERLVITPHNAAESADESIARYFLRQIERLETGKPLENIVDPKVGY